MEIEPELLSRIIAFQNRLTNLYDNAFKSPLELYELDRGMQELLEAWDSVKDFIEASEDEEVD